jgi:hypothetical protein
MLKIISIRSCHNSGLRCPNGRRAGTRVATGKCTMAAAPSDDYKTGLFEIQAENYVDSSNATKFANVYALLGRAGSISFDRRSSIARQRATSSAQLRIPACHRSNRGSRIRSVSAIFTALTGANAERSRSFIILRPQSTKELLDEACAAGPDGVSAENVHLL